MLRRELITLYFCLKAVPLLGPRSPRHWGAVGRYSEEKQPPHTHLAEELLLPPHLGLLFLVRGPPGICGKGSVTTGSARERRPAGPPTYLARRGRPAPGARGRAVRRAAAAAARPEPGGARRP